MQDFSDDVSYVPIEYEGTHDEVRVKELTFVSARKDRKRERIEQRISLENHVARLQKKLTHEVNLRHALHRGLSRPLGSFPRISTTLPAKTRELLLEVALLEEEVVSLEKRVMFLSSEIDNQEPLTEEEMIWHLPIQVGAPARPEIMLSPSLSPRSSTDSSNFSRLSNSPQNPVDQKVNLAIPLHTSSTDHRINFVRSSVSPRNSTDHGYSPTKPPKSPRDFIEQRIIPCMLDLKDSIDQRCTSAKTSPRQFLDCRTLKPSATTNSNIAPFIPKKLCIPTELEESFSSPSRSSNDLANGCVQPFRIKQEDRRVSPRNSTEQRCTRPSAHLNSTHITPFFPVKLDVPTEDEDCLVPVQCGPERPSNLGVRCAEHLKKTSQNSTFQAPSITARSRTKDPVVAKMLASVTPKAPVMPRSTRQDNGSTMSGTHSRQQPQMYATISGRRATRPALMPSKPGLKVGNSPAFGDSNDLRSAELSSKMDFAKPAAAKAGSFDSSDFLHDTFTDELYGEDYRPFRKVSSDQMKGGEHLLEGDNKLDLEEITDSGLLSEELVKLLGTIYSNMQQQQHPLSLDSGASSQTSISTCTYSTSPDHYETKDHGASLQFIQECYGKSFKTKRGASSKFLQDCYSGEVADTLDPYGLLRRGNQRNPAPYQQRVKS